jgi:hypothetical protein
VRVARRLFELPQIRAAFGRGEVSYSQVRALSRVATPELEESLLELARHATAAQLERTLRAYRGVLRRERPADERTHGERYVVCEYDEDGALLLRARLPAEEGALVVAALDAARDTLREASEDTEAQPSSDGRAVSAETPVSTVAPVSAETPTASNADALMLMAETVLSGGVRERCGGDNYQVVVHVDADALASEDEPGQLDDGPFLHPETARKLCCDASVVRLLERDGRPLSVGRRTRTVSPALRRALKSRDHCCRFPGCTQRRFLHPHHIIHWAHGGPTDLWNLVQLCRFHHGLLHEGGYTMEWAGTGGALRFRRPDGRAVPALPELGPARGDPLGRRNRGRGLELRPDTCASRWMGDRLDLPLAIDGLVGCDSRLA